jgi:hypothetical protein
MATNINEYVCNAVIGYIEDKIRIQLSKPFYIIIDNYPDVDFEWVSPGIKYDCETNSLHVQQYNDSMVGWEKPDFKEHTFNNMPSLLEWLSIRFDMQYETFINDTDHRGRPNKDGEQPFGFNTRIYRLSESVDKPVWPHLDNFERHGYDRISEYEFVRSFKKDIIMKCVGKALEEIIIITKTINKMHV